MQLSLLFVLVVEDAHDLVCYSFYGRGAIAGAVCWDLRLLACVLVVVYERSITCPFQTSALLRARFIHV